MVGSAVIGGFILAMIEGTGILINRYSQMFMPQPGLEGNKHFHKISHKIFDLFRTSTGSQQRQSRSIHASILHFLTWSILNTE